MSNWHYSYGNGGASSSSSSSSKNYNKKKKASRVLINNVGGISSKHKKIAEKTEKKIREMQSTITRSSLNTKQREIADLILSGENVFLTGVAGTGKSYLFKYVIQELKEKYKVYEIAITAPTGIAAVNINGQTLHSWAGIGLGKESAHFLSVKLSRAARGRWISAKVILIDEISMVDSELLEKLSEVGKYVRENSEPFGGVQVVTCGDFLQLPPVGLGNGKDFAFRSSVWNKMNMRTQKLTEVVRQQGDMELIEILNQVRLGNVTDAALKLFQNCHINNKPLPKDGILPTELRSLNRNVDAENERRLNTLDSNLVKFEATDEFETTNIEKRIMDKLQDLTEKRIAKDLKLKIGAQVVLLRNLDDTLVNGSRGVVRKFVRKRANDVDKSKIRGKVLRLFYNAENNKSDENKGVLCPYIEFDNGRKVCIFPFDFFVAMGNSGSMTRIQFPLKLAWSLTIHKSQGMTLSRCLIDASKAFEYGQTYVALSRCVSREGLWITGPPITNRAVKAHPAVLEFYKKPEGSIYDDDETAAFWDNINVDAFDNNNNNSNTGSSSMDVDNDNMNGGKKKRTTISPDIARRIEENKRKAMMKLKAKQNNAKTMKSMLSPEQQQRIEQNKKKALAKLVSKKDPLKRKHEATTTTTATATTTTTTTPNNNDLNGASNDDDIDWNKIIEEEVKQSANKKRRINSNNSDVAMVEMEKATTETLEIPSFSSNIDDSALQGTLFKYYGYNQFRDGQLDCIKALLNGIDTAVFWATGKGKSMVYQLPSLYSKKITLVISPLISLMVDQVKKLNSLTSVDIACYLGSAQMNPLVERKALNGDYLLVYLTPEKIAASSFLDQMRNTIGFVAIDEAHCVSEWGHDFRPDYRKLSIIKQKLPGVPLCLLTATAGSQVQSDILDCLGLSKNNTFVSKSSFDRENLKLVIKSKSTGGIGSDFKQLMDTWKNKNESTIIYCPTKNDVEKVVTFLRNALGTTAVASYHGGMTTEARNTAHLGFLSSQFTVIVATIAFGMGIDKPDIRRIVHYGTPKTMEEYYQHIGRGGRDGLESVCHMFYSSSDFVRYKSPFYTKNLSAKAIEMSNRSGDYLRNFVEDGFTCRRCQILKYFNETPAFGTTCGNCDNCIKQDSNKNNNSSQSMTRDFINHAHVIFTAMKNFGNTAIAKTKIVDEVKEVFENNPNLRRNFERNEQSKAIFASLLPALVRNQYLSRSTKKNPMGYRSYEVYNLTVKARRVLNNINNEKVMLPVPDILIEIETKKQERIERTKNDLISKGIDLSVIPLSELQAGAGPILNAYTNWIYKLKSLCDRGRNKEAENHEELLGRIEKWRLATSVEFGMAPHNVMSGHVMRQIAYVKPTTVEALESIGVRIRTVKELAAIMLKSVNEFFSKTDSLSLDASDPPMVFPENKSFKPKKPWLFAKEGKGSHRSSYERFQNGGETIEQIAMRPENGKTIQPFTVVSHVMKALTLGDPVNLKRLAAPNNNIIPPPSEKEWEKIEIASNSANMDVVATEKFQMKLLLPFIVGEAKASVDYKERSESLQQEISYWYRKITWWMNLRRAGFTPQFGSVYVYKV